MIKSLYYYDTKDTFPYRNLAVEEYLLRRVGEGECILYLWQNRHTVVIGRNQNAWAECRIHELEESGGHLVRRLSGGGAVYHDLGNLNFTFLVREADYDVKRQLSVILHAVRALGLEAELSGRNDITILGQKFSGNAFYRSQGHCYHHGTLLVNVDMSLLSRYLNVSPDKLASKGVKSVRSRVVNLTQYLPDLTVDALRRQLVESFGAVYGLTPVPLGDADLDQAAIDEATERFASWEWRCGAKVAFSEHVSKRFDWGGVELNWQIDAGLFKNVRLFSDGLEADLLASLPEALEGCRYEETTIRKRLADVPAEDDAQRAVINDVTELLCGMIE